MTKRLSITGAPIPRCACGLAIYSGGRCYSCHQASGAAAAEQQRATASIQIGRDGDYEFIGPAGAVSLSADAMTVSYHGRVPDADTNEVEVCRVLDGPCHVSSGTPPDRRRLRSLIDAEFATGDTGIWLAMLGLYAERFGDPGDLAMPVECGRREVAS